MGMPITVKGQVTIPKPIRDRLGLTPGSRVEFVTDDAGRVLLQKAADATTPGLDRFERLIGCGTDLKGMGTDEIMRLLRGDDTSDR
jgi:AbrB family looped-hinge helix DNA binding protein